MKTLSIHSGRGGTGKTLIATNLACILANRGFNVALLDVDFRGPGLAFIFPWVVNPKVKCWLNDFLNGRCNQNEVLVDISDRYNFRGKLQVGFANPSIAAIQNVMSKSQAWELTAVKKLFSLLSYLNKDVVVDYCIFDTSPGIQYSSINALVASDLCIMVMNSDVIDLEATKNIIRDIADNFQKKTVIILNKYCPENRLEENTKNAVAQIEAVLKHPVISKIPCYCDVLQANRTELLAVTKQDHPFVKQLEEVANKIVSA